MGKKSVLVTGAAGFIGSNLCEKLLSEGYNVLGIDNLSTGYMDNLNHLLPLKSFEFRKHDVTVPLRADVFQIYNLASSSSQQTHVTDPINTIKTVVQGTFNMLELARKCNATILQASTSKIYGTTHASAVSENTIGVVDMMSKSAPYIESKCVAETTMTSFWNKYGTDIRIARIFNTYGPNMWQDENRIISMVIERALMSRNITIYDNALQYRTPCYVDDVVEALIRLMNATPSSNHHHDSNAHIGVSESCYDFSNHRHGNKSTSQQLHSPVNIGNPERITIKDLVEKIIRLTNSSSKVKYMNLSQDTVGHCTPDITTAKNLLDWQPQTSLEVGLARTIEYFERKLSNKQQGFPCLSWIEMA